ncbi:MAG TPA: hypothetical protein VN810_10325, partial [Terriglobales bacterium]|nr:hypothetical protein [Terriglobales bacterium]
STSSSVSASITTPTSSTTWNSGIRLVAVSYNPRMQPARQQTLGLILIALLILIFTVVRFARLLHWSGR